MSGTAEEGRVALWPVHSDRELSPAAPVLGPRERISRPLACALGLQHVAAISFAGLLVPKLTGMPISTTLLFSGIGTLLFLVLAGNQVPGYLGPSYAFLGPLAASAQDGVAAQLGGVLAAGLLLTALGIAVKALGIRFLESLLPPVVTGAIVLLVGMSVTPVSVVFVIGQPVLTAITVLAILLVMLLGRGVVRRFAVLIGLLISWLAALPLGGLSAEATAAVSEAPWFGLPVFNTPVVHPNVVVAAIPAVVVLAAEYVAHIKAVSAVTGRNLDGRVGDAVIAGGLTSVVAGLSGGAPVTNSLGNLGVLAASKVYATAPCAIGGVVVAALAFCPKFTAALASVPYGVVAGASIVVAGMIVRIALRIWRMSGVVLAAPVTLVLLIIAVVGGSSVLPLVFGDLRINGPVWGAVAILAGYPVLDGVRRAVARVRTRAAARTNAGPR